MIRPDVARPESSRLIIAKLPSRTATQDTCTRIGLDKLLTPTISQPDRTDIADSGPRV